CKKGALWLVVAMESARINLKRLHATIGSGRLSFGRPDLLLEVLGVPPGSVTPFALINDNDLRVSVVLDADMMAHDLLNFHPLVNNATTAITRDDLLKFIADCGHEPAILPVSETGPDAAASP
ncbi:MAG: prolyl-tRNA synthetase associated domain-containing protein, partial [Alphaproteobacteria bacterium]